MGRGLGARRALGAGPFDSAPSPDTPASALPASAGVGVGARVIRADPRALAGPTSQSGTFEVDRGFLYVQRDGALVRTPLP
jgi:hypothetical protein